MTLAREQQTETTELNGATALHMLYIAGLPTQSPLVEKVSIYMFNSETKITYKDISINLNTSTSGTIKQNMRKFYQAVRKLIKDKTQRDEKINQGNVKNIIVRFLKEEAINTEEITGIAQPKVKIDYDNVLNLQKHLQQLAEAESTTQSRDEVINSILREYFLQKNN